MDDYLLDPLTTEELHLIDGKYPPRTDHRIEIGMCLMDWATSFEIEAYGKLRGKLGKEEAPKAIAEDHRDILTQLEIEFMMWRDLNGFAELRDQLIRFINPIDLSWHLLPEPGFSFDCEWVPHFMENLVEWDHRYYPELHEKWLDCVRKQALQPVDFDNSPTFVKPSDLAPPRGKFDIEPISVEEVKAYREETGAGLLDAKNHIKLRNELAAFELLMAEGTLEDKINWLLARYRENPA